MSMPSCLKMIFSLMVFFCAKTFGEAPYYPEGKEPRPSLQEKVEKSAGYANTVVRAFMEPSPGGAALKLKVGSKNVVNIKFVIDDVFKGDRSLQGKTIEVALTICPPGNLKGKSLTRAEIDSETADLQKNENRFESRKIDWKTYWSTLGEAKTRLTQSSSYMRDFVLVPISAAIGDSTYRSTNIVLQPQTKYILMVFNEKIGATSNTVILPSELDVYPATESEVRIVKKTVGRH